MPLSTKKPSVEEMNLNFDVILIITYGRSGSTLLQGILNSISGVLVRGENANMCYHVFYAYQAILEAKKFGFKNTKFNTLGLEANS